MKINQLFENVTMDEIKNQPYFKKFPNLKLYRGLRKQVHEPIKMPFKYRTEPLDTLIKFHNIVNELAQEQVGLPIRNLIFTTPAQDVAESYGKLNMIVPIGNFKLYYNPEIIDMTGYYGVGADRDFNSDALTYALERVVEYIHDNEDYSDEMKEYMSADIESAFTVQTLDNINHQFHDFLIELYANYDDEIKSEITNLVEEFADVHENEYSSRAQEYVEGVEEINNESDYDPNGNSPEIMVYAPNGYYLIPVEDNDL